MKTFWKNSRNWERYAQSKEICQNATVTIFFFEKMTQMEFWIAICSVTITSKNKISVAWAHSWLKFFFVESKKFFLGEKMIILIYHEWKNI